MDLISSFFYSTNFFNIDEYIYLILKILFLR